METTKKMTKGQIASLMAKIMDLDLQTQADIVWLAESYIGSSYIKNPHYAVLVDQLRMLPKVIFDDYKTTIPKNYFHEA